MILARTRAMPDPSAIIEQLSGKGEDKEAERLKTLRRQMRQRGTTLGAGALSGRTFVLVRQQKIRANVQNMPRVG